MQDNETQETGDSRSALSRLRGNSPFIVITVVYLFSLLGVFYVIETFYLAEKWETIQDKLNRGQYLRMEEDTLTPLLRNLAEHHHIATAAETSEPVRERNLRAIEDIRPQARERMETLIEMAPILTAMDFTTAEGEVLLRSERPERLAQQHDFSNSLLTRSFVRSAKQTFRMDVGGHTRSVATWNFYITTARGDPDIKDLTIRYWRVLFVSFAILTLVYYVLLRFAFLPLRRVVLAMQLKRDYRSPIISNPRNLLERVYNNLARDAALTRLSKELRERITTQGVSYAEPILQQIPELINRMLGISTGQVWTFHRHTNSHEHWIPDHCFSAGLPWLPEKAFRAEITARVTESDPLKFPAEWQGRLLEFQAGNETPRTYFCGILDVREEHLWLFVIHVPPRASFPNQWWREYYARVAQELRFALSSVEDQRRLILQEKSKANISLSRNLGHDLTNIIATAKLELMTVRAVLSQGAEALQRSSAKEKLFQDALEALLNNTRFLQEIVNLYRSFSYLQKPKFEMVSLGGLVEDVVTLYRLTLSTAFRIEVIQQEEIPPAYVEPRLLRLALFNVLTNAVDAIKRTGSEDKPEGLITVTVDLIRDGRWAEVTVEDTGPGIQDGEGKLMSPDGLAEIFRLGYTTKANQEGEGLGLNWVQSIVREFHGGEVAARNREQGGAAFLIRIPLTAEGPVGKRPERIHQRKEPAGAATEAGKG